MAYRRPASEKRIHAFNLLCARWSRHRVRACRRREGARRGAATGGRPGDHSHHAARRGEAIGDRGDLHIPREREEGEIKVRKRGLVINMR